MLAGSGCTTAAPAGDGTVTPPRDDEVGLEDLQGEWLYLRVEDEQLLTGDCITISDDLITEFIDHCDGDDLLLSSASITADGDTFVLRFTIIVTDPDEPAESVEITATLTPEGDIFVGTEETDPPLGGSGQIVLRRPEG